MSDVSVNVYSGSLSLRIFPLSWAVFGLPKNKDLDTRYTGYTQTISCII